MRYQSIEMTMEYYVDLDADDVATELYEIADRLSFSWAPSQPKGDTLGDSNGRARKEQGRKQPEKQCVTRR
jgi:hypothetical protein